MTAQVKIALYNLASGLVLDRSVLVTQSLAEMASTVAAMRAAPKKAVTVIENGASFFTSTNMLDLIKAGDEDYRLIAEKAGVTLRPEDVQAITAAEVTKASIIAAMIPPIPPYTFAAIPANWSIVSDLTIGKVAVRRLRTNSSGNSTGYSLSIRQLKLIWAVAAPFWQNHTVNHVIGGIASNGFTRTADINMTNIVIGCQTIQRYELEQLALALSWEFPEVNVNRTPTVRLAS